MKYAIVTGGTSGIGLGVAKMLVSRGYYVFVTYSKHNLNEQLDNIEAIKADQSNRSEVYHFINYIKSRVDRINCIVCNAGLSIRKPFTETTDEDWDKQMDVAVTSHMIIIRELFQMISKESRIIFTGSVLGCFSHATVLSYGVTKTAVNALAKNLVKEFEGTGITVNVVAPGFVETPWQKDKPEEIKQNIYKKTAIHRFASIDEVVDAYRFCIENPFVNGSVIEVNGGYCYK